MPGEVLSVHPDGIVHLTVEEFDHLQGECEHGICNYARKMRESMAFLHQATKKESSDGQ